MPYRSDRQRRFFHTETARQAGITPAMVKEFDEASRGKKLPKEAAADPGGLRALAPMAPLKPSSPTTSASRLGAGTATSSKIEGSSSLSKLRQTSVEFDAGSSLNSAREKLSDHVEDRIRERTPFDPEIANELRAAVKELGLGPGAYHYSLKDKDGAVRGIAQFRSVPNRQHPVLVTVLSPTMRPSGRNLGSQLNLKF